MAQQLRKNGASLTAHNLRGEGVVDCATGCAEDPRYRLR